MIRCALLVLVVVSSACGADADLKGVLLTEAVAEPDSDESVQIANHDSIEADLGGWAIRDDDRDIWRLPPSTKIPSGGSLTVHVGAGPTTPSDLYLDTDPMLDAGDTLRLLDAAGSEVHRTTID